MSATAGTTRSGAGITRTRSSAATRRGTAPLGPAIEPWPGVPVATSRTQQGAFSAIPTPHTFGSPASPTRTPPPSVSRYCAWCSSSG